MGSDNVSGTVAVKHASGKLPTFTVTATTAISGSGVKSLKVLTKGSIVDVTSSKGVASKINVTSLAATVANTKPDGPAVTGKVVSFKEDPFGDQGQISIQPTKGGVLQFKVTNATRLTNNGSVCTMGSLAKGKTVSITSAKGRPC